MRKINDWENVQEQEDYKALKPGGYICFISNVEDNPDKEYLKITYDIARGEFEGYFKERFEKFNFVWGNDFYRSYKENCASMFKSFIVAVEKSNNNFEWDWNENKLVGKFIGLILQEEEYIPQGGRHAGEVMTRLIVNKTVPAIDIKNGNFKVPETKKLKQMEQPKQERTISDLTDDSLPF